MTTRTEGIAKMTAFAERQPTGVLCQSLEALNHGSLTEAERLSRAVLMDVLCERHPEADAAFDAWAEGDDSAPVGAVLAITTAAREAAREAGRR